MARPITFLSDYGYADEFAGVCRGVIAEIAPDARVIDITHGVRRHAVRQGAVRVADRDRLLVGPDNGVLGLAVERLGGAVEAVDLSSSALRLQPVTSTFHGRDLFAPIAAHVLYVDGFGNVALNIGHEQLASTFLRLGERVAVAAGRSSVTVPFGRAFSDVGEGQGIMYEDSSRSLALAVNRESAAELLGLAPDDEVVLSPATEFP